MRPHRLLSLLGLTLTVMLTGAVTPACSRSSKQSGARASASVDAGPHPLAGQAFSTWAERPGVCSLDFWCWFLPQPQGQRLTAGWAVPGSPDEAWFVGMHATLMHVKGPQITAVPTNLTVQLNAIWGSSAKDIWAGGGDTLLHGDGVTWTKVNTPPISNLGAIWGRGPDDVWVTTAEGPLHYDGKGFSAHGAKDCFSVALAGDADDVWLLCAGRQGQRLMRWNDGAWREVKKLPLPASQMAVAPGQVFLLGAELMRWDGRELSREPFADAPTFAALTVAGAQLVIAEVAPDQRRLWTRALAGGPVQEVPTSIPPGVTAALVSGSPAWFISDHALSRLRGGQLEALLPATPLLNPRSLWGSGANDVWAANGWRSHWDGKRWSAPEGSGIEVVWGTGAADVWAAGDRVEHWDGSTWKLVQAASDKDNHITAMHGSGPGDVWMIGPSGVVLHWNGSALSEVTGAGAGMRAVWARSATDAWMVGSMGDMAHWDGKSWSSLGRPAGRAELRALFGVGDDLWAVGMDGTMLRWQDKDPTWKLVPSATKEDLNVIWGPRNKELWAAGREIVKWDGKKWERSSQHPAEVVESLWGPGRADAWMGTRGGLLRRLAYPD